MFDGMGEGGGGMVLAVAPMSVMIGALKSVFSCGSQLRYKFSDCSSRSVSCDSLSRAA